jgi:hypothetical protein
MVDETASEPRYARFRVHYAHVVLDSVCLEGGGTLRAVQIEHPLAVVEVDEDSRVPEAAP